MENTPDRIAQLKESLPNVYTVDEVASVLKLGRRTIMNYIKAGRIKAFKLGNKWCISEESLMLFLQTTPRAHQ